MGEYFIPDSLIRVNINRKKNIEITLELVSLLLNFLHGEIMLIFYVFHQCIQKTGIWYGCGGISDISII